MKDKIIVIAGATATGKTDLSIKLAKKINGEIVSADSMMVYKYMDIGTAKPTEEEKMGIKHYVIDVVEPSYNYSVQDFIEEADKSILKIRKKGKIPIVVGGTWLYIQALLYGLSKAPKGNETLRKELYEKNSVELYEKLKTIDKEYAEKIHQNDKRRIVRALEVYYETGKPFSYFQKKHRFKTKRYNFSGFILTRNREEIMKRVEQRVEKMFKKGLVEEVKNLMEMGYEGYLTSKQAIGYKELIPYIKGETTLSKAKDEIIKNTKTFAKRQIRTFKNKLEFNNITLSDYTNNKILDTIIKNV